MSSALYHWSPASRREGILATGLQPGHPSVDGSWTPDYLCLATTPHHAWWLNLQHHRDTEPLWDLWQVYEEDVIEPYPRDDYPAEIRTKHPVREAYLIGSRDGTPIIPASMATGEDGIRTLTPRTTIRAVAADSETVVNRDDDGKVVAADEQEAPDA